MAGSADNTMTNATSFMRDGVAPLDWKRKPRRVDHMSGWVPVARFVEVCCAVKVLEARMRMMMMVMWVVAALCSPSSFASDVELSVDAVAALGATPKLKLVVHKDVKTITLNIQAGAARVSQKKGPVAAEDTAVFDLPHRQAGVWQWKGTLDVLFADDSTGSMPLAFSTEVRAANFSFEALHTRENLRKDHLVRIKSTRPVSKLAIEVYGEDDELLASTSVPFDPPVPTGNIAEASWVPLNDHEPLRVHVDVYDDKGTFRGLESFPYDIEIPHVDVEFETGKSDIRASEEPKLQAAIPEIETALRKYGTAMKVQGVTVKLFVSGHTDTVGNDGTNRTLSNARARAIASWFSKHGVKIAVYARGFGEDMLKVKTEDNVDNAQNRRVEYNVGVEGPTGSLSGWMRVGS
jgi:outer membrane protein OmpA-like peptidoglycan-associated protein